MSIDLPLGRLHISCDVSVPDVVMEGSQGSSFFRENSLPANALTSCPTFCMRTSLTPQPQRKVSELPALSNLVLNPIFVRPPPIQHQESQQPPTTTSGSLVETVGSKAYDIYVYHIVQIPSLVISSWGMVSDIETHAEADQTQCSSIEEGNKVSLDQLDVIEKEKIGKLVYELG
ncbi:hypothetical protein FA15DRAFT_655974 [Coprinopsis marcescibilis]|uniref:Uncharacterized protein n=1 Tax=Coprinopsis marcescibilis TaxID=230819 RepID=A0A5C3KVS9_COPMA|nr:hypothetical protein FA15DRAFT_655974 [Coprinopsis marcescibilis]